MLEPPSSRGQLPGSAELSQMLGRYTASTRIVGDPSLAHRPARPRLLLPKLRTAGSCRCAGLEGYQFPKWSAKGAVSSRSLGKLVEVSRGRQPPASTVESPMPHLRIVCSQQAGPARLARRSRRALSNAPPSGVPRPLKCHALERSQFGHARSDLWAKMVSRIYCWSCIGVVTTTRDFDLSWLSLFGLGRQVPSPEGAPDCYNADTDLLGNLD